MRTIWFIFCFKKISKLEILPYDFGESKVVFIAILQIQICFLDVKTRFFINFSSILKAECVQFGSFFASKKISKLEILPYDFGERKVVFIAIFQIQIYFLGVKTPVFTNFSNFLEAECIQSGSFFAPKKTSKLRILPYDFGGKKRWFL